MGPIMTLVHESYNLIKNPEKWTQGYFQKDIHGNHCSWREGYSFCALGVLNFFAINRIMSWGSILDDNENEAYHGAVCILQRHSEKMFGGQNIATVNDSTPASTAHQNVLRIYESVIERFSDRDPTEEEWRVK